MCCVVGVIEEEKKTEMLSGSEVVKVQREALAACMTCPLCNSLFKDATTISECLHTFCRKCIYKKITEEELNSCPICNIELGCAPLEKLRADHNLQDLRAKIFHSNKQISKASQDSVTEVADPAQMAGRRKQRSLASLVNTPKTSSKNVPTGRRSKPTARNSPASRETVDPIEETIKKSDNPKTVVQAVYSGESSKSRMPDKDTDDGAKACEKTDIWEPLTSLVEAASISKPRKSKLQETFVQAEQSDAEEKEGQSVDNNVKDHGGKKVHGDKPYSTPSGSASASASASGSVRPRRSQGAQQRRSAIPENQNVLIHSVTNANWSYGRRCTSTWFSLVASNEQEGDPPLPQIPSHYLRVKDGNVPVSAIKKYLMVKLGLASESEVEISLLGESVHPTMMLHNLIEFWLETAPASEIIHTTVGSSGKDFVMPLTYGRPAPPPA